MANREIEWRDLGHAELVSTLEEGLGERDRRIQEMQALMGVQQPAAPRGPGRPRKDETLSTRAQQLAAAAEGEAVQ